MIEVARTLEVRKQAQKSLELTSKALLDLLEITSSPKLHDLSEDKWSYDEEHELLSLQLADGGTIPVPHKVLAETEQQGYAFMLTEDNSLYIFKQENKCS